MVAEILKVAFVLANLLDVALICKQLLEFIEAEETFRPDNWLNENYTRKVCAVVKL